MSKTKWYIMLILAVVYTGATLKYGIRYNKHYERLAVRQNIPTVFLISTATIFLGAVIMARPGKDEEI